MASAPSATPAQNQRVYEQIVDTMNAIFGAYPGYRSAHAKGVVCEGTFTPAASAVTLSRAAHFRSGTIPMTVRFSDGTGIPTIPDPDPNASPRGLALRFHVPGGGETDIVSHSWNGFPVGTAEEFLEMFKAIAATKPDSPKPTPIEAFLGAHPRALAFVTAPKPASKSFATLSFYAVNAFRFTNKEGVSRFARYQIRPNEREAYLSAEETAAKAANYLFDELAQRLVLGPAKFKLSAQLAAAGDPVDNASIPWPDDRPQIALGEIVVTKVKPDSDAQQRKLIFDPIHLIDGIELSGDPLPAARSAIYGISYERRNR